MEKGQILQIIRENLVDGRLPCEKAHDLAIEYQLKLWQIGQICEEEKIKIKGCQLGCF